MEVDTPDVSPATPVAAPPVAESKTPIQQAVESGDTRTYREERHKQRQDAKQGRTPVTPAPTTVGTPKPAASEPAATTEKPRKNADTRVQELLRERGEREKQWERERQELLARVPKSEQTAKPADPAPKSDAKGWQRYKDLPDAPKLEQFDTHEDYLDARSDFIAEKRIAEALGQRDQASEQDHRLRQSAERYQSHETEFRTHVLEWKQSNPEAKFDDGFMSIPPMSAIQLHNASQPPDQQVPIGPHHFVIEQVFLAEPKAKGPLCAHFSANPQEFKDLCELAMRDEYGMQAVVRRIGQLEAKFLSSQASTPASPAARISAVPAPATTLGRKASGSTVDPLKRAIQSGDTRAYRELRHQERQAGRR